MITTTFAEHFWVGLLSILNEISLTDFMIELFPLPKAEFDLKSLESLFKSNMLLNF